jgi:alkylation response protein AidB-like acyl-CoA dehydrogenase
MHQSGVDVRPLREMTGRALFNEVFLSDARVPDAALVGGLHNGWAVANTTLAFERSGLGAGAGAPQAACQRRARSPAISTSGSATSSPASVRGGGGGGAMDRLGAEDLHGDGQANGKIADPVVRQKLMKLHTLHEVGRMHALRQKRREAGAATSPGTATSPSSR